MVICDSCKSEVQDNLANCPTCNNPIGYPNVRSAENKIEETTLEKRYQDALNEAENNGYLDSLVNFDSALSKSKAVINIDIDFLHHFITYDKALYSTYLLQVEGEARLPAIEEFDSDRISADSIFFGSYSKHIRHAALSLNKKGLKSYGDYSMTLKDVAIRERASLLESNSYKFITDFNIRKHADIPSGYRAAWENRTKLAVSKLHKELNSVNSDDKYAKILLKSGQTHKDRATDDYIEVHIYGKFDNKAIESVSGKSAAGRKDEQAMLNTVKEFLDKTGIDWIEE